MKKSYEKFCAGVYSFLSTVIGCTLCIFAVFLIGIRIAEVDGNSMYPGLVSGDKIIISGIFYTPEYGDIVAIGRADSNNNSFIKRIVGLPGDEIDINFDTHIVTVNGYVVPETYKDDSLDSRFSEIGFIKLDEIAGKAIYRIYPFGNFNIYK